MFNEDLSIVFSCVFTFYGSVLATHENHAFFFKAYYYNLMSSLNNHFPPFKELYALLLLH